jgi:hypothetical protein
MTQKLRREKMKKKITTFAKLEVRLVHVLSSYGGTAERN